MVPLSPRDELAPAKSQAPSQISLQSALMAARLRNVTQLELLNHYLNSGSMMLIKGDVESGGRDGRVALTPVPGPTALPVGGEYRLTSHHMSRAPAQPASVLSYSAGSNIELSHF